MSVIRAGLLGFLAAQGGGITLTGDPVTLLPLGMLLIMGRVAWRAGRALADAAAAAGETGGRALGGALAVQTACYLLCCAVIVPVASLGSTHASLAPVLGAGLLLFATSSGLGLYYRSGLLRQRYLRLAPAQAVLPRAAAAALSVYVAAGALLAVGSLVLHASQAMALSREVGGGVAGLPIAILGALTVPNAAVAGASYLAGPGFAVGAGTTVDAFSTSHGLLPAFPLLAAVPSGHGANPLVLVLMVLTPLAAGAGVALLVRRAGIVAIGEGCRTAVLSAIIVGVALAVLAWQGGGGVGPGRLHVVGASEWQFAVAAGGAVAVVSCAALLALWFRDRLQSPSPDR